MVAGEHSNVTVTLRSGRELEEELERSMRRMNGVHIEMAVGEISKWTILVRDGPS